MYKQVFSYYNVLVGYGIVQSKKWDEVLAALGTFAVIASCLSCSALDFRRSVLELVQEHLQQCSHPTSGHPRTNTKSAQQEAAPT